MTMPQGSMESHVKQEGDVSRTPPKGIYVLPNLFTLASLFGGFYAIVMAMNNHFELRNRFQLN